LIEIAEEASIAAEHLLAYWSEPSFAGTMSLPVRHPCYANARRQDLRLRCFLSIYTANDATPTATPTPTAMLLRQKPDRSLAPLMCSGRTPNPTTRARACCIPGICTAAFSCHGGFAGPGFWKTRWKPLWANSRQRRPLAQGDTAIFLSASLCLCGCFVPPKSHWFIARIEPLSPGAPAIPVFHPIPYTRR